jgi:superfamily I DNA and RNA helicase
MDRLFTGAQLSIMTNLDKVKRGVVIGGAGTGKTLLATELALRFANEGLKTLVLTSSDPLVEDISRRLPRLENLAISKIESVNAYFDSQLKWDAVIIDEAQDVASNLWDKVEGLLDSKQSRIYAFLDSNQSIYRPPDDLSTQLNAISFELNLNLRNTKVIAKATELLYSGPLILAHGPEGEKPTCIQVVNFSDAVEKCILVVNDLARNQNVSLGDICLLVRDKDTREKVQYAFLKRGFPSTNAPNKSYNSLCVETIARFKGLESNIVITLCDFELANSMEMSYISLSRARSRFFLIGNVDRTLFQGAINSLG